MAAARPGRAADRTRGAHRGAHRRFARHVRMRCAGAHGNDDGGAREIGHRCCIHPRLACEVRDGVGREHDEIERLARLQAAQRGDATDRLHGDTTSRSSLPRFAGVGEHVAHRHRGDAMDRRGVGRLGRHSVELLQAGLAQRLAHRVHVRGPAHRRQAARACRLRSPRAQSTYPAFCARARPAPRQRRRRRPRRRRRASPAHRHIRRARSPSRASPSRCPWRRLPCSTRGTASA